MTKTSLTEDRFSEHNQAIKKACHRQTRLPRGRHTVLPFKTNWKLRYTSCHTKTSATHTLNGLHRHARTLNMLTNCHICYKKTKNKKQFAMTAAQFVICYNERITNLPKNRLIPLDFYLYLFCI